MPASRDREPGTSSSAARSVDVGVNDGDPAVRQRVEALYPNARKVIVDSDHRIQEANPEFVVKAIKDVVAAGRRREAPGREELRHAGRVAPASSILDADAWRFA